MVKEGFLEVVIFVLRFEVCVGVNWVKRGEGIEYFRLEGIVV